jgi:hypothetical protein
MRQSQTAVIERKATYDSDFATEPFEVGWAAEARWFVKVMSLDGDGAKLHLVAQVSPDGLTWTDHESGSLDVDAGGLYSWPMASFGNWLRIRGSVEGQAASATVMIYLSLKS